MNSRDRVLTALNHEQPDRVPVDLIWPRIETLREMCKHFAVNTYEEVFCHLGLDMRGNSAPGVTFPDFEASDLSELKCDYTCGKFIMHDDVTFEDAWGVVHRVGAGGKYAEWVTAPLVDADSLEEIEAWNVPAYEINDIVEGRTRVAAVQKEYATWATVEMPFKTAWQLRGMENWMCDMLSDPDMANCLLDKIFAYTTDVCVAYAKVGHDIIGTVGDIAAQNSMLISPALWREMFHPRMAALHEAIRAVNPNAKILYHSDGDVSPVIDDFIECGIDILNPVQPESTDPSEMKARYGDKLSFHGTVSAQVALPQGTVEDVRRETRSRIDVVGKGGGLLLANANCAPFDTPLENILAMYKEAGSLS